MSRQDFLQFWFLGNRKITQWFMLPSMLMWIQYSGPTWWKERIKNCIVLCYMDTVGWIHTHTIFLFLMPYWASPIMHSGTPAHVCTVKGAILSSSFYSVDLRCKCLWVLSHLTLYLFGARTIFYWCPSCYSDNQALQSHFKSVPHQGQYLSSTEVINAFCSFKPNNSPPIQTGYDFNIIAFLLFFPGL